MNSANMNKKKYEQKKKLIRNQQNDKKHDRYVSQKQTKSTFACDRLKCLIVDNTEELQNKMQLNLPGEKAPEKQAKSQPLVFELVYLSATT